MRWCSLPTFWGNNQGAGQRVSALAHKVHKSHCQRDGPGAEEVVNLGRCSMAGAAHWWSRETHGSVSWAEYVDTLGTVLVEAVTSSWQMLCDYSEHWVTVRRDWCHRNDKPWPNDSEESEDSWLGNTSRRSRRKLLSAAKNICSSPAEGVGGKRRNLNLVWDSELNFTLGSWFLDDTEAGVLLQCKWI